MSSETLLAFAAIVGLLITAASVIGSFRISRNTSTVKAYRESAQAWETKARAQEAEIGDMQTKLATADAQIESLNQRVAMLQDMVTSRTLIEALAGKADEILALSGDIRQRVSALQGGARG